MVFVVANHKGIFLGEKHMSENWKTVWAEVEVSNLGNVRLDVKKIQEQANKKPTQFTKYDKPTMMDVRNGVGNDGGDSRKKQIICIDTNEVFESLRAASKHTKTSPSMLCRCIQWGKADTNGLRWAYYTE